MGKIILCTGNISRTPFLFSFMNTKVYSIEELCYYVYNNIYIISEEDFTEELTVWIEMELGIYETAIKLRKMLHRKADLKDIVVTILCCADYYEEQEIKDLIKIMDKLAKLGDLEKNKLRADNFLKNKKYFQAEKVYCEILEKLSQKKMDQEKMNKEKTSQEKISDFLLGNILHNLGITKIHSSSYEDAAITFREANQKNKNRESLLAYVFCMRLAKKEIEKTEEIKEAKVIKEAEEVAELSGQVDRVMREAEMLDIYLKFKKMQTLKEEGKVDTYYDTLYDIIVEWKEEYKNGLV